MKCKQQSEFDKREFDLPTTSCPHCGAEVDMGTVLSSPPHKPKVGDFGVCIECASPNRLDHTFQLRKLTDKDWHVLHPEDRAILDNTILEVKNLIIRRSK